MTSGTITREQFEVRQIKDKRALSAQKKQVLICAGTGCIAGGSLDIYDYLKEACAKRGIQVQVGLLHEDGEVEAPAKGENVQKSDGQEQAGEESLPPGKGDEGAPLVENGAPFRGGGLDAQTQEAHGRAGEHAHHHIGGGKNHRRADHVGQQVAEQNPRVGKTGHTGGLNELRILEYQHFTAHQLGIAHPSPQPQGDEEVDESLA